MPKVLVLHDTFLYKGGGERLILMIANALEADIASGFFSEGSYNLREQGFKGAMIPLMPGFFLHEFTWMPRKMAFIFKNGLRHFGLKWAFSMNVRKLRDTYDTVILSGDCLSAVKYFRESDKSVRKAQKRVGQGTSLGDERGEVSESHFESLESKGLRGTSVVTMGEEVFPRFPKVLYYCHTIPRYLFDQREQYEQKVPKIILYPYRLLTSLFRKAYLRDLGKIEYLLTNSKNTQKRIKTFTYRDAEILYPPVDTAFFSPSEENGVQSTKYIEHSSLPLDMPSGIPPVQSTESDNKNSGSATLRKGPVLRSSGDGEGTTTKDERSNKFTPSNEGGSSSGGGRGDSIECVESPKLGTDKKYYLSFARLSSIKRVDRIVAAFQNMPEERLIITYGKNDPERQNIMKMTEGYTNIEMRESPSDIELRELIRGARATIYIPVDEDFGMSPVESMSCGTPVIAANDGGLKESVVDGKTGILIDPRCDVSDIIEAVKKLPQYHLTSEDCLERAADFSLEKFTVRLISLQQG